MSANKHTPGPWTLWGRADPSQVIASESGFVAQTVGGNDEPNARLIAAAPDSHTANVLFVESMNRFCGVTPDWDDDRIYDELPSSQLAQAYFAARAAIAKAGGAA